MTARRGPTTWKPGQSGNPKGRTPGSGEIGKLRASISQHVPGIIDAMVSKAMEGDSGAARLLLERALPPIKASEQVHILNLPEGTLTEQGRAVLSAVAAGELPPAQGAQLVAAIGQLARVVEIDELERRIAALEGSRNGKKP